MTSNGSLKGSVVISIYLLMIFILVRCNCIHLYAYPIEFFWDLS
uniref:Uncharacterized protein n=1 Tax=Rhizophora mucronata TaxID=61149 RepID=A0A2P2K3U0_RHIMU